MFQTADSVVIGNRERERERERARERAVISPFDRVSS